MAQAQKIQGKDFLIFIGGKAVAATTSTEIEFTSKTADSSTKDDGLYASEEVVGLEWSLSNDSFYTVGSSTATPGAASQALEDAWRAGVPVEIQFGRAANAGNGEVPTSGWTLPGAKAGYKGKAIIQSLRISAAVGEKAKVSISLKGHGELLPIA